MRLRDLDAQFVGAYKVGPPTSYRRLRSIDGAQGLLFQCPKCAVGKPTGGNQHRRFVRGAHYILCWFANPCNAPRVPDNAVPTGGRWTFAGDKIDAATLSPSVNLPGPGCGWHGWVKSGEAA